jgi:hypothetical protein
MYFKVHNFEAFRQILCELECGPVRDTCEQIRASRKAKNFLSSIVTLASEI